MSNVQTILFQFIGKQLKYPNLLLDPARVCGTVTMHVFLTTVTRVEFQLRAID